MAAISELGQHDGHSRTYGGCGGRAKLSNRQQRSGRGQRECSSGAQPLTAIQSTQFVHYLDTPCLSQLIPGGYRPHADAFSRQKSSGFTRKDEHRNVAHAAKISLANTSACQRSPYHPSESGYTRETGQLKSRVTFQACFFGKPPRVDESLSTPFRTMERPDTLPRHRVDRDEIIA